MEDDTLYMCIWIFLLVALKALAIIFSDDR